MGIPSYFSYLIKHHKAIVKRLTTPVDRLCLDSNSIIYDVVHSLEHPTHDTIIQGVCKKIDSYIQFVKPQKGTYISFDGVPPMAKAHQQRERRYKGWVIHQLMQDTVTWDTVQITPGTEFMHQLDTQVTAYFQGKDCIVSTSQEPGEGEHKIMDYLRGLKDESIIIYGLDADLILLGMLQPLHIELMREAPDFIKVTSHQEGLLLLDLPLLRSIIEETMSIQDYVFITLLLGNDFMPHFPSLQLRLNGMDVLLDTYRKLFKKGTHLYDGTIQWNNVRILIQSLSVHEQMRFQENDKIRKKPGTDIQDIPRRRREVEIYINPYEAYWEDRYYHRLFYSEPTPEFKKKVVHQYLEMMTWNMDYYTLGCKHWDMYYSYNYAPLLKDISTYFVDIKMVYSLSSPLTPSQLLAYVMPRAYLGYLPKEVQKKIKDKWYSNDFSLEWSYCTYLWESHVHFPCISLKEIKQL